MGTKALIFLGILFAIVVMVSARDLAETEQKDETKGVEDSKYPYYGGGRYGGGGGSYGGGGRYGGGGGRYGGGGGRYGGGGGRYGGGGGRYGGGRGGRCCGSAAEAEAYAAAQAQAKPEN